VRRTLRSRTTTAATAALLLAAATIFTTGATPAAASATVKVMDFNICGAICNHGRYGVVDDVRNRVLRFRPAILTLNEVCAGQFWRLQSLLQGSAWKMSGVFRPQRHDSRCPGGGFGDAVLTAGAVGRREVLPLPNLGPEHRAILCLRTSAGGPVLACTLHLVTGRGTKGRREKYLQRAAAARSSTPTRRPPPPTAGRSTTSSSAGRTSPIRRAAPNRRSTRITRRCSDRRPAADPPIYRPRGR
jgi:hypothetical protein